MVCMLKIVASRQLIANKYFSNHKTAKQYNSYCTTILLLCNGIQMLVFVLNSKILPLLVICSIKLQVTDSALRITGGRDANPEEYPYIVRMEVRFMEKNLAVPQYAHVHICTAACLSATWLLSAAHCVEGYEDVSTTILSQAPFRDDPKAIIRYAFSGVPTEADNFSVIISAAVHPNYRRFRTYKDSEVFHNDICLLKITPVILPQYGKLGAPDFTTLAGQSATAVGFGLTQYGEIVHSTMILGKPLQITKVIIKNCHDYANLGLYPTLCLSGRCDERPALCAGDSGGPLLHSSGIVGVNSKGVMFDCQASYLKRKSTSNTVGLITPISPFLEWISDIIRPDIRDHNLRKKNTLDLTEKSVLKVQ